MRPSKPGWQVRDFVYISDRAYTKDQVLGMEKIMLNTLKFNLTVPTPHNFLTRFLKASPVSECHLTDRPESSNVYVINHFLTAK